MTRRTAQLARLLTFAGLAALVAVAALKFFAPGAHDQLPTLRAGELRVSRAIDVAGPEAVTVRGDVFVGPGGLGLRLCDHRRTGSPPACVGPFLDLAGVNEGSFALRSGRDKRGRTVKWQPESVTLLGSVNGTLMTVEQVLR